MQLAVSDEVVSRLERQAADRGFDTVEEYLGALVGISEPEEEDPGRLSNEERVRRFREYVAALRAPAGAPRTVDDSRESIYPVR